MALPIDFPSSPYEILDPDNRWFPDQKTLKKARFTLIRKNFKVVSQTVLID